MVAPVRAPHQALVARSALMRVHPTAARGAKAEAAPARWWISGLRRCRQILQRFSRTQRTQESLARALKGPDGRLDPPPGPAAGEAARVASDCIRGSGLANFPGMIPPNKRTSSVPHPQFPGCPAFSVELRAVSMGRSLSCTRWLGFEISLFTKNVSVLPQATCQLVCRLQRLFCNVMLSQR